MSTEDIIQNMIAALGQSQGDRAAAELSDHFVDVDERTPEDLLVFARALAPYVRHHGTDPTGVDGDFVPFWPAAAAAEAAELLAATDGNTPPHLALFAAFLALHEKPRALLNRLTARHLDFYYRRVLRFEPRPAVPDRAHVVFELKRNAPPVRIVPDLVLSAGKDAGGAPRLYQPVREVVIGGARIAQVCSTFIADRVYCAPDARSGDGVGGPLPDGAVGWAPFGSAAMPVGSVGFALSSPVLRLAGGTRQVTLHVKLAGGSAALLDAGLLQGSLEAFFTGEKAWLGPFPITASRSGDLLQIGVALAEADEAVVDHDRASHGASFSADAPVIQLVLKQDAALPYAGVKGLFVGSVRITVNVEGLTALTLESDLGGLDPKKAFLPFGPEARKGARFMIGCPEALSKTLSKLSVHLRWHGLPGNLATVYQEYPAPKTTTASFTVSARFRDGTGADHAPASLPLFASDGVIPLTTGSAPATPRVSPAHRIYALGTAGTARAAHLARIPLATRPMLRVFASARPASRAGFITFALDRSFRHEDYRLETLRRAANVTPSAPFVPLGEPVTPAIEGISLAYEASTSAVDLTETTLDGFANPDIRFFHVDGFGERREHAYLREQLAHVGDKRVPLFPTHDDEGELLLGLTGLAAGDGVSLLLDVAEGSADPDLTWPEVAWSVLADNHWKRLDPGALVLDTTHALRRSGLVVVVIPREATTENSLLPAGRLWLKAAVPSGAEGISRLVDARTNGVEVRFVDHDNDPGHLSAALPKGSINKLKTPVNAVKAVTQPQTSFGGRPFESTAALTTRASERLRHKDRAVTPWDYERIVLDGFPGIHRVKCVPHARKGSFKAPGSVLLVVVPDLRNKNARDRLAPCVDPDTLSGIAEHVRARAGMGVAVDVVNPTYQKIRLDFQVKLRKGCPWTTFGPLLKEEITTFLSPWAYDAARPISFGGSVYKSVLLDFVEERSYVDYLVVFKMYSYVGSPAGAADIDEATPATPDAILVSDAEHVITEIT